MPAGTTHSITEKDLCRWRVIVGFKRALGKAVQKVGLSGSFADPRRCLQHDDYLALFLFGLLNPALRTMRGLCAASHLNRVQQEICSRPVSLGSFSEAQAVLDVKLLEEVFKEMATTASRQAPAQTPELTNIRLLLQDSTIWEALPRMEWAHWRTQYSKTQKAVRLNLSFNVLDQVPVEARVTEGRCCERAAWRKMWQPGQTYVGDRNFGRAHKDFQELIENDCHFVLRLHENINIEVLQELPLTEEDKANRVLRQAMVRLGDTYHQSIAVRLVWVQGPGEVLLLATSYEADFMSATMVAAIYALRWQIELFFRWIKCILGCRHWLAESPQGVTIQVYLALIAALLLQGQIGQRPNRRMMELIQLYMMGMASEEELERGIARELERLQQQLQKRKKA